MAASFILFWLLCAASAIPFQHNYPGDSIIDNSVWLDTSGQFIHAHGGQIYEFDDRFYLIGTTQKENPHAGWTSQGINCYSSSDLVSWTFENEILRNSSIDPTDNSVAQPPWKLERPKILLNAKHSQFVLWFHLGSHQPYHDSITDVALANCSRVCGDYQWIGSFEPDGLPSYDMGLFQDGDTAYLVRSVNNSYAGISELNDAYTNSTGIISKGPRIEGVALFVLDTYYLMGSHLTSWTPNAAELCATNNTQSDSLTGAVWKHCPNPTNSSTTYGAQSTYVVRLEDEANGNYVFLAMFDVWNSPNVDNATYLWLPLNFSDDASESVPTIPYLQQWRVSDFAVPIP